MNYVLYNSTTQKLVGIDNASGGYPYDADLKGAHFWTNLDDLKRYQRLFPNLEIKIFNYQLSDLPK